MINSSQGPQNNQPESFAIPSRQSSYQNLINQQSHQRNIPEMAPNTPNYNVKPSIYPPTNHNMAYNGGPRAPPVTYSSLKTPPSPIPQSPPASPSINLNPSVQREYGFMYFNPQVPEQSNKKLDPIWAKSRLSDVTQGLTTLEQFFLQTSHFLYNLLSATVGCVYMKKISQTNDSQGYSWNQGAEFPSLPTFQSMFPFDQQHKGNYNLKVIQINRS